MNWLQFGRLIHSIYRDDGKLPDIEWIQGLGLLAVKLGQVHALRIDFLDEKKCQHLAQLYRKNTPLPAADFFSLLGAWGIKDFAQSFALIDDEPLATASVGQVHRARLKSDEEVVVKILKADVREEFAADVRKLKGLFNLAIRLYPPLRRVGDPIGILEDIEELTSVELDLRNELEGQKALRRIQEAQSQDFDLSQLKFPTIHEELSNDKVLVSEFIDAPSIDELLERESLDYDRLLDLFRIHGFFMFVVGTFHGDLHPGNVLIRDEDFYFIDTAFIATVTERLKLGLFDFFEGLTRYDYEHCAKALHAMSESKLADGRFAEFEKQMLGLYRDFEGATVSAVSLTQKMMETIKLGVRSGMSFDRGMFGIIRSLMYLDGMVLRCNPNAVLIRDMRTYVEDMLSHRQAAEIAS